MAAFPLETLRESELPRPPWDVHYQRGFVSDYYEVRPDYHILRRRGSATSYLVYSVSGTGFFRDARDRAIRLGPGDLALMQAHHYQEYGVWPKSNHWGCHWVHFDAQPHWSFWLPLSHPSGLEGLSLAHVESKSVQLQLNDLFFAMHSEAKRGEAWSTAIALNLLERILIVVRTNAHGREPMVVDSRISQVLQAIETNAPSAPSAAELGRIVGLSASRLAHLFKQHTGISLLAAVNRVRLRAAQRALQDPAATLQDAAERCGFRSPFSFSNWYLKQTGERPGEYQRQWAAMVRKSRPKHG